MAKTAVCSRRRNLAYLAAVSLWLPASVLAGDVSITAQVDKTAVKLGDPVTLTITLNGDISRLTQGPQAEFPDAFRIAARSQSSNLSVRGGTVERSVSFVFVLVAGEPGTFQLGPFLIEHEGKSLTTEPIEVVVNKPVLPPKTEPGERFLL